MLKDKIEFGILFIVVIVTPSIIGLIAGKFAVLVSLNAFNVEALAIGIFLIITSICLIRLHVLFKRLTKNLL